MPFTLLSSNNLRNLKPYKINPSPFNNLVVGLNGAGKTNLLEGIYLNALGKSFRTSQTSHVIQQNKESCLLFSKYISTSGPTTEYRLGVERYKSRQQTIHVNGENIRSLSQLAMIAPTVAIQPLETNLLDGQASNRRKFIDMLMFHVEPSFLSIWQKQQGLLKQRNQLLKQLRKENKGSESIKKALRPWTIQFVDSNESIAELRNKVFCWIAEDVGDYLSNFDVFRKDREQVELSFFQGWDKKQSLLGLLEQGLEKELERGFTLYGGHRADIRINAAGVSAKDYLSRGQKKLLCMVMRLAQAKLLKERAGKQTVLLIDDLYAELDEKNCATFIQLIENLGLQSFFTCVSNTEIQLKQFRQPVKVFHVEHGEIS